MLDDVGGNRHNYREEGMILYPDESNERVVRSTAGFLRAAEIMAEHGTAPEVMIMGMVSALSCILVDNLGVAEATRALRDSADELEAKMAPPPGQQRH